jgi:sortase A
MKAPLRWVEIALLAVAVVALSWYGVVQVQEFLYQRSADRALEQARTREARPAPVRERPKLPAFPARLEVPRLGLSAMVRDGVDDATLRRAVGHIPETALPGDVGNAALAGHRDTFFRPLKKVRRGDRVRLTTPGGVHEYVVRDTKVVAPTDVSVLNPTRDKTLTLVTCYPFNYVGSAPKRFVVRATSVEAPTRAATAPALIYASMLPQSPQMTKQKVRKAAKIRKARPSSVKKRAAEKPKKSIWRKIGGLFS